MARLILVLALAALSAACAHFPGIPPSQEGILQYDWVAPQPRPEPPPLYCYGTLDRAECYEQPVPGRTLLGNYGAPPPLEFTAPQTEIRLQTPLPPAAAAQPYEAPPAVPVTPVERRPASALPKQITPAKTPL